jgi:ankyrin repeat protein
MDIDNLIRENKTEEILKYISDNNYNCIIDELNIYKYASAYGRLKLVEFFISQGVGIDKTGFFGMSALHKFSMFDNLDGVKFCIDNNANIELKHDKGETAFYCAAGAGKLKILKFLQKHGAKICGLTEAAFHNQLRVCRFLIENGVDLEERNDCGFTTLHSMCIAGRKKGTKFGSLLIESGADVNTKGRNGSHICVAAAEDAEGILFQKLLDAGMEINHTNKRGDEYWTPLEAAKVSKNKETIAILSKLTNND